MPARLKAARLNKGLSIAEAAPLIGVSEDVLERAERGQSIPQPRHAKTICDFYGFRVTDIWPVADFEKGAAA